MAFKVDKKEEKSMEKAQKDAEMVSELAKDARNRREAKTISNKLEAAIENIEGDQKRNGVSLSAQQQEDAIESVLDETKNNIRHTTREAEKEIPQYIRMVGNMQKNSLRLQEKLQITT